ncbi:MAG: dockerin type I repeat-containing protein [Ruminococcus sp.]|nr:dockerin type I repeat-containing protein [Ruminococcus sp.]
MKKSKFVSAFLAVVMAFSAVPAINVSAAEDSDSLIEIASVPENLCDNSFDKFIYGMVINVTDLNNETKQITLSKKNTIPMAGEDYSEVCGYASQTFLVNAGDLMLRAEANIYISDYAEIRFNYFGEEIDSDEVIYEYPATFEIPSAFAMDGFGYKTNEDDTLTLVCDINKITNEKTTKGEEIVVPTEVHGKTVSAIAKGALSSFSKPASVTIPDSVKVIEDNSVGYYIESENNIYSPNMIELLAEADDNDAFDVVIELFDADNAEQCEYIINTYFNEDIEYEYYKDFGFMFDGKNEYSYGAVVLTATKAELLGIKSIENIYINTCEEAFGKSIDVDFAYLLEKSADDEVFNIVIEILGGDYDLTYEHIMGSYFDGNTEHKYDSEWGSIYLQATKSEILAMDGERNICIMLDSETGITLNCELARLLDVSSDDDTFDIAIDLCGDDYDELCDYIISTYFDENTEYEYNIECGIIYLTATKEQILSIGNEEPVYIYQENKGDFMSAGLSELLYDYVTNPDNAGKSIEITIIPSKDYIMDVAQIIADEYFDGTTDYTMDLQMSAMSIVASVEQVLALNDSEYIVFAGNSKVFDEPLYLEYIEADEDAVFNLLAAYTRPSILHPSIDKVIDKYFAGCELEKFTTIGGDCFIAEGVTKAQLDAYVKKPVKGMYLTVAPTAEYEKIEGFVIYGTKGSAAEAYANANGFEFVDVNSNESVGDVNLDGDLTIQDATLLQRYQAEIVAFDDTQLALADFDGDGSITVNDVTAIQRKLAS